MDYKQLQALIEQHQIKFLELRFVNILGQLQQISIPVANLSPNIIDSGYYLDKACYIIGWEDILEGRLSLKLDLTKLMLDPFAEYTTLAIMCDVYDNELKQMYPLSPRTVIHKLEELLTQYSYSLDIHATLEFWIFDNIRWDYNASGCFVEIKAEEATWSSKDDTDGGNLGHRPTNNRAYLSAAPQDLSFGVRNEASLALETLAIPILSHAHSKSSAGQNQITTRASSIKILADNLTHIKHTLLNTAQRFGKTATFMVNPIALDKGAYLALAYSLDNNSDPQEIKEYYLGGILKHIKALNAFMHPTTNSYKGQLGQLTKDLYWNNTSFIMNYIDANVNNYLTLSAILLAGIDGIINKIKPSIIADGLKDISYPCKSLSESLYNLNLDRSFLKQGDVFSDELIDKFIALKLNEVKQTDTFIHPVEFDMYYSI